MPIAAMASGKIGDWDVATLIKVVRDLLEQQTIEQFETLGVTNLTVNEKLTLKGSLALTNVPDFTVVGSTGAAQFTNAWVNYGAPYYNAGYWIDPLGFVHLRGIIKSGTLGSSAFQLPPGYRPSASLEFLVLSNGTTGRVTVAKDGTVTPVSPSSNLSVSLDQICFRVP